MTRNELTKLWAKVTGKFNALIDGAPEALDTLKEIADKLGDDDDALAGLLTQVAGKQDALVSGQNIKTVNNESMLGSGNVTIHEAQLIDKSYAPAEFSGLGRKYLQKNIVSNKNVLTQSMMQDANTIYVIQYDYDLNGQSITVPSGCVLQFDGGSLRNGTVVGNDTAISAEIVKIFSTDVILSGTWNVDEAYPEWFGAKGDGTSDDTDAIQNAMYLGSLTKCPILFTKEYAVFNSLVIDRSNINIKGIKTENVVITRKFDGNLIKISGSSGVIRNLSIYGLTFNGEDREGNILDYSEITANNRLAGLYIEYSRFTHTQGACIAAGKVWNGRIVQCMFETSTIGFNAIIPQINCINFIGDSFYNCDIGVQLINECYAHSFINCTFQETDTSIDIKNSYGIVIENCYFEGNGSNNSGIITGNDFIGLSITGCTFTTNGRDNVVLFSFHNANCITINNNYISKSFISTTLLEVNTIINYLIQDNVLKKTQFGKIGGKRFFASNFIYHRPDRESGTQQGDRMFQNRYSDAISPIADLVWDGRRWAKSGPLVAYNVKYYGTTSERPTSTDINVGFQYWDTDLGKMIIWNGSAWVDSSSIKNTSTIPAGGLLPNVVYNYGTTDTVSVTLAAGDAGVANIWCFVFTAQTAACTVTLPSSVVLGNEYAWDMVAGRRYEVSIMDNVAIVNYND